MKATTTSFLVLCITLISATATAEMLAPPDTLMCTPGELLFSDDFDPATVSDRWFFKAEVALRDGAMLRTDVDPTETKRVFLKTRASTTRSSSSPSNSLVKRQTFAS